jgi:hypothetical protein
MSVLTSEQRYNFPKRTVTDDRSGSGPARQSPRRDRRHPARSSH